jgi:hypothetical protein
VITGNFREEKKWPRNAARDGKSQALEVRKQ